MIHETCRWLCFTYSVYMIIQTYSVKKRGFKHVFLQMRSFVPWLYVITSIYCYVSNSFKIYAGLRILHSLLLTKSISINCVRISNTYRLL